MNFRKLNKKAWQLRKYYANKMKCSPAEISWQACLVMASESIAFRDDMVLASMIGWLAGFAAAFISVL